MNEEQTNATERPRSYSFAIPVAIIIGFGMIAAAIYFSGNQRNTNEVTSINDRVIDTTDDLPNGTLAPITEEDHIRGNPNAPIAIIEYSDFDCPFCKAFHETMTEVISEYGVTGEVAWVYRHFPLSIHPSAKHLAEASECVASLGGNDAFWTFADLVFGERGTNEQTDVLRLPEFAAEAGVDQTAFTTCLDSNEFAADVAADQANGASIGVTGTPYTFWVVGNQVIPLSGALPYDQMRTNIEGLLAQLKNASEATTASEAQ